MVTQNDQILDYLKTHTGITTLTAIREFGITRLSARIHDLRSMGYRIGVVTREVKTRTGKTTHVAEYRLVE